MNAEPGRSRREALAHGCQGQHRPRSWLAPTWGWLWSATYVWEVERFLLMSTAGPDAEPASFSRTLRGMRPALWVSLRCLLLHQAPFDCLHQWHFEAARKHMPAGA